jgi:hypothetical protein
MKKTHLLLAFAFSLSTVSITSCSKDKDEVVTSNSTMSGSQEVPAVTTSATGTANVTYNKTSKLLSYNITWSGLSGAATAMHFHGPALPGVSASVLVGVSGFPAASSGNVSGSFTVTNTATLLESDLLAGKWYFNIHTAANPTGEIRGQVSF